MRFQLVVASFLLLVLQHTDSFLPCTSSSLKRRSSTFVATTTRPRIIGCRPVAFSRVTGSPLFSTEEDEEESDNDDDLIDTGNWIDDDDDDDDLEAINGEEEDDDDVLEEEIFEEEEEDEDIPIVAAEEDEYEYEYVEVEESSDEDDGDDGDYELQTTDENDPNYARQIAELQKSLQAREQIRQDENFDALDFLKNKLTDEGAQAFDSTDFMKQVEERAKNMVLTEDDVKDITPEDIENTPDIMDDDPYPRHKPGETNVLEETLGITDQDMEELDDAWKAMKETQSLEPWDKVTFKAEHFDWDSLPNETLAEIDACLIEIGGAAYNSTNWLLYDLDFNVTNLILAAVKHNREAPLLMEHWYPQLLTYKRYEYARASGFDWTWEDVEGADISELERYYAGFGYDSIPLKAPSETGIISLEDLDEEEIKMAAFEKWMTEVYNANWDRKDFDDNEFRDEDNVFSKYFEYPDHPDLPKVEDAQEDLAEWAKEMNSTDPDVIEYRDFVGRGVEYKLVNDTEFQEQFRGHLVIACTGQDSDLEIAEKITKRMGEEHGKQVFVETRVMGHAREEDNVFEVWLESYEIDLLHSKKRASLDTVGWDGPAECDDEQVEYLVKEVGFLISDDSRYSYRPYDESLEGCY